MLKWSDNVMGDMPPVKLDANDFTPSQRAYPFADTVYNEEAREQPCIKVDGRSVTFIGQRGPMKDYGVNGCQIEDMLTFALGTLQTFQKKFPCRENALTITHLEEALHWQEARRWDREARNVEGRDQP
jgi:hypothetical protein